MDLLYMICLCALWTKVAAEYPTLVIIQGESARIKCIRQTEADAYVWSKRDRLNTSQPVASILDGIVTINYERFNITSDGTLFIYNVSSEDEGTYFCQTASRDIYCYGRVVIYVQVETNNLVIEIDKCNPTTSCVHYMEQSSSTTITCTARSVPLGTLLRWYSDTNNVIGTEDILYEDEVNRLGSISITIDITYTEPVSLICHAINNRTQESYRNFAAIQIETKVDSVSTPAGLIATIVIFAIIIIALVIGCLVKFYMLQDRKQTITITSRSDDGSREEMQTLTETEPYLEKRNKELLQEINDLKEANEHQQNEHMELSNRLSENINDLKEENEEHKNELDNKEKTVLQITEKLMEVSMKLEQSEKANREVNFEKEEKIRFFCRVTPVDVKSNLIIKSDTSEVSLSFQGTDYTFNHVYPFDVSPRGIFQSISDLIENAIDGHHSCILSFGGRARHHWNTMYGTEDGDPVALIPNAIDLIFSRIEHLREIGVMVDTTAKYVYAFAVDNQPYFACSGNDHEINDVRHTSAVDVSDKETATKLFTEHRGTVDGADSTNDSFIQFFVETRLMDERTESGAITFATIYDLDVLDECFKHPAKYPKKLASYLSDFIFGDKCKSVILTHVDEETDDIKKILQKIKQLKEWKKQLRKSRKK